jgi:GNAT superfamily N-acetyltransferase
MVDLEFELARPEHAKAIERMRSEVSLDLNEKLGQGHWSGISRIASIRERIAQGDPVVLRHKTLFVATRSSEAIGSVSVSTWPPGFWKREFWREPKAIGLGVFDLAVFPEFHGQGVGRFLMEGAEGLAKDRQIAYVRLDAYTVNPFSTGFYKAIGYEERGEIDVRGVGLVLFEKKMLP